MYGTLGHFECIGRPLVSYLLRCIIRQRAISRLDNTRCSLSRLVNEQLQAGERAFTVKACMLHRLKGAWHRAVSKISKSHNCVKFRKHSVQNKATRISFLSFCE